MFYKGKVNGTIDVIVNDNPSFPGYVFYIGRYNKDHSINGAVVAEIPRSNKMRENYGIATYKEGLYPWCHQTIKFVHISTGTTWEIFRNELIPLDSDAHIEYAKRAQHQSNVRLNIPNGLKIEGGEYIAEESDAIKNDDDGFFIETIKVSSDQKDLDIDGYMYHWDEIHHTYYDKEDYYIIFKKNDKGEMIGYTDTGALEHHYIIKKK